LCWKRLELKSLPYKSTSIRWPLSLRSQRRMSPQQWLNWPLIRQMPIKRRKLWLRMRPLPPLKKRKLTLCPKTPRESSTKLLHFLKKPLRS